MVTDPKEIEIISSARQKNVADPRRSRVHFFNIFDDFFDGMAFKGQAVLDMGPGHWDFGVILKEKGGRRCIGIDNDPAVLKLGIFKGFDAVEGNLKSPQFCAIPELVDGLFCKFALNAFWYWQDEEASRNLVRNYLAMVKPDGWIWVSPWNGVPAKVIITKTELARRLEWQREEFLSAGCREFEFSDAETRRYGVHGNVASSSVFLRNLTWSRA